MRMTTLLVAMALCGCESGVGAAVDITLAEGSTDAFSADAPGILRMSWSDGTFDVGALCGQTVPSEPFKSFLDFGFGCLDDEKADTTEPYTAWIEPLPAGWEAEGERLCASPP